MYCDWASLQGDIQCDKANQSVLHKFPTAVGREVACTVVKSLAQNVTIAGNNEPSNLVTDKEVKWTMEVMCFGLSLPLNEHETIKECVNVYCDWLSACTEPKTCVPKPVIDNPNPYTQKMIHHLLNLFVPRPGSGLDLVKRQAMHCHRVLRAIEDVTMKSTVLTRDTWETLLKFLLAANDSLLSPPTEKDDIGDHLCERVLSVLFEIWLLACQKCFPSPSLWKTFRNMCINWRHHETLVVQWHKVNHALTSRLLKFLYGPGYPTLQLGSSQEEGNIQLIPDEMSYDTIAQCWFRYLHVINNPVDMCHPEIISNTPKFRQHANVDPSQHECLNKLPYIFFRAMRGIAIMVNAFLGIAQSMKADDDLYTTHRQISAPSTPPGQRKTNRPISSVIAGTLQKGSSKAASAMTTPKSSTLPPNLSGHVSFDARQPLAPSRPKCNSILHLFGAWLFDAALARVSLHSSHKEQLDKVRTDSRSGSFTDSRHTSISLDFPVTIGLSSENSYEAGRAEAIGALCRIFCAHKTKEDILPIYYSRFYISMYYGLQIGNDSISGQVLSSILFNSCDLLRVNLDGVMLLVPYILAAIQLILWEPTLPFKLNDDRTVELRRSCIHLLLSMLCLPLHYKDLQIKEFISEDSNQFPTFISLRRRITELLLKALMIESDPTNTQMMLGGLLIVVQDQSMYEEAENSVIQPNHDNSSESLPQADTSHTSLGTTSSETSYTESSYHRLQQTTCNIETAFGLFGQATSEVCTMLRVNWKNDLNNALAAMEVLSGLAKVSIKPPNLLMCKRTVKWICDFIVLQCNRPSQCHTRDLHSMIVAAFKCLTLWLVEHYRLLYDKECLHNVLEVVELGISGSKSQNKTTEAYSVTIKESKSVSLNKCVPATSPNESSKTSDVPKFKGDKQLMPASMRVKEAAEGLLTVIIEHVGAFPPPCGPESLFSLLDEKSLLKYYKVNSLQESGSQFKYYVLDNSIIVGLLEHPLSKGEDPLPTVTALIRGPFGRHAWAMQLRHSPRSSKTKIKPQPRRPMPNENVGTHYNIKRRFFPESSDKIQLTAADRSIPSLESLVKDSDRSDLNKLKSFIYDASQFENDICRKNKLNMKQSAFPNQDIECKVPRITQEYQTARLFLSHYGFLSLEALKDNSNSSIPPALVMLDTTNSGLFTDLEILDTVTPRDNDTVHVFYVKSGQKNFHEIIDNVSCRKNVQPLFIEFLQSLGWPVAVKTHAGWTGNINTSWKITDTVDDDDNVFVDLMSSGGGVYDGRNQVLYWADVSSEIAFVVPSTESKLSSNNSSGDKSPLLLHRQAERSSSDISVNKPKTLSLDRAELTDKIKGNSPTSPHDPPVFMRKAGRQPALMVGPDIKILVVWLENFQDHENFPTDEILGVTSTGMEHLTTSLASSTKSPETFIIFIHTLQNGLFRIHMQGTTGRINMAIPLVNGMVVSRRILGPMVRQTAINIGRRKRLESESYQPPHVRRKFKIQEMVNKYHLKMTEPEFYTALFHDVPKRTNYM